MDLPVVCSLTNAELQARRKGALQAASRMIIEEQELEDGFAYQFPSDYLTALAEIVHDERQCCRFLTFQITADPNNGPVWLKITGPAGSKQFLSSLFKM